MSRRGSVAEQGYDRVPRLATGSQYNVTWAPMSMPSPSVSTFRVFGFSSCRFNKMLKAKRGADRKRAIYSANRGNA